MEVTEIKKEERVFRKIIEFIRGNIVFIIALILAIFTSFIVKPDKEYFGYINYSTICALFSTLAIVNALKNHHFFIFLANKIVKLTKNMRMCALALTYTTFIGSMLIANDMALITFLPLTSFVLLSTGNEKHMIKLFVLQNIAANLGGMLTPFGNPQNLYLYSFFDIPTDTFVLTMLVPFLVSITLITLYCILFFKKTELKVDDASPVHVPLAKIVLYLAVFLLVILSIFRLIPYYITTIIVFVILLLFERSALSKVDYPLLLTFVCFFIFSGNLVRIDIMKELFERILENNVLIVSALSCQFISNVPTAILLSKFTTNCRALLLGVNIGGVGSLISSLASLITFRNFRYYQKENTLRYLVTFSLINLSFLATLIIISLLILN